MQPDTKRKAASKSPRKRKKTPVGYKIAKLMKEGYPHKQAVAIALRYDSKKMLGPRGGVLKAKTRRLKSSKVCKKECVERLGRRTYVKPMK